MELWSEYNESGYYISNFGHVRHMADMDNGRRALVDITPEVTEKGYRCIRIAGKRHRVHRLVAELFLQNPNGYKYVHHIDGDMSNNASSNLEWVLSCPLRKYNKK